MDTAVGNKENKENNSTSPWFVTVRKWRCFLAHCLLLFAIVTDWRCFPALFVTVREL